MVFIQNESIFLEFVKNLLFDLRVDADLRELSEYVLTIIKGDKTLKELHGYCLDELGIFLNKHTEVFVNKLMKSLDNDAYLDCATITDDTEIANTTTSETNDNSDIDDGDNRKHDDLYADLEYSNDDNNNAKDDNKDYINNNNGNYKTDTFSGYKGEYRGGRGFDRGSGRGFDRDGGRGFDRGGGRGFDGGYGRGFDRGGGRGFDKGRGGRGSYDGRGKGYDSDPRGYNSRYPYNNPESLPVHATSNKSIDPYDVMSFYPNNSNINDDSKPQSEHDGAHMNSNLDSYNSSKNYGNGMHAERPYTKRSYSSSADNSSYNDQSCYSYKKPKTSAASLSYSREGGCGNKVDHTEIVLKKKLEEEGRIKNQYDEMKQLREQALEIKDKKIALMKKYKAILSKLPATELSEEKQKLKETLTEKVANLEKELSVE